MELSTASTLDAVKAVVVDTFGIEDRADTLHAASPLFGSLPELDSLGVAELVVALEQRFDVEFDGDDVSADTFETLGSLAAVIEDKPLTGGHRHRSRGRPDRAAGPRCRGAPRAAGAGVAPLSRAARRRGRDPVPRAGTGPQRGAGDRRARLAAIAADAPPARPGARGRRPLHRRDGGDRSFVRRARCSSAEPTRSPGARRRVRPVSSYARDLAWDAVLMLDADSVIEPGFFAACERALAGGAAASRRAARAAAAGRSPGRPPWPRSRCRESRSRAAATGSGVRAAARHRHGDRPRAGPRAPLPRARIGGPLLHARPAARRRALPPCRLRPAAVRGRRHLERVRGPEGPLRGGTDGRGAHVRAPPLAPAVRHRDRSCLEAAWFLATPPFALAVALARAGAAVAAVGAAWAVAAVFAAGLVALASRSRSGSSRRARACGPGFRCSSRRGTSLSRRSCNYGRLSVCCAEIAITGRPPAREPDAAGR